MPQAAQTTDPIVEDNEFYTERRGPDGRTYTIAKPPPPRAAAPPPSEKGGISWKDLPKDLAVATGRVGAPAAFGGLPGALMGLADVAISPKPESGSSTMANVVSAMLGTKGKAISRIALPALAGGLERGAETGNLGEAARTGGTQAAGGTMGEALAFLGPLKTWIGRGVEKGKGRIDDLLRGVTQGAKVPDKDEFLNILRRVGEALPEAPERVPIPPLPPKLGKPPREPGAPPSKPPLDVSKQEWTAYQEKAAAHRRAVENYPKALAGHEQAKSEFDELLAQRNAAKEAPLWQDRIYEEKVKEWREARGITQDEMMGLVKAYNKRGELAGVPDALLKSPSMLAGTLKALDPPDQATLVAAYLDDVTKKAVSKGTNLPDVQKFVEELDKDAPIIAALPAPWRDAIREFREKVAKSPNPAAIMKNNPATWILHHAAIRLASSLAGAAGGGSTGSLIGGLEGALLGGAAAHVAPLFNPELRALALEGFSPTAGAVGGATGRAAGEKAQRGQELPDWVRQQYLEAMRSGQAP